MTRRIGLLLAAGAFAAAAAVAGSTQSLPADREALHRINNRGVALLEQFRFADAAAEFRRALTSDPAFPAAAANLAVALLYVPDLPAAETAARAATAMAGATPHASYLLGLIARAENRIADAEAAFKRVLDADARDIGANYMLGQIYLSARRLDEALTHLRAAVAAEPFNTSAAYSLGQALIRSGRADEGRTWIARFETLRTSTYQTTFGTTYLSQGRYAEAIASTGSEPDLVDRRRSPVTFHEAADAEPSPQTVPAVLLGRTIRPSTVDREWSSAGRAAIAIGDLDGVGGADVLVARPSGIEIQTWRQGVLVPMGGLQKTPALAVVPGDYDNDGRLDLLVLQPRGLALFRNDGQLRFADVTAAARLPANLPALSQSAAFADVDHDGDLDIFIAALAGAATSADDAERVFPTGFAPAASVLLQNNGNGTFADVTARAKLDAPGHALAVIPTDFDNRRDLDLLVVQYDGRPRLYRNLRDGTFADVAADVGLNLTGRFLSAAAADVNKDGFTDFFFGSASGPSQFALSTGRGTFEVRAAPVGAETAAAAQFFDFDLDGLVDLFVSRAEGPRLFRNVGDNWVDETSSALRLVRPAAIEAAGVGVADIDRDGDYDILTADARRVRALRNDDGNRHRSMALRLTGRVTNRAGVGAKIEVRAGSLWQKFETSAAAPAAAPAEVVAGIGPRDSLDAVRILWVSGILQTETTLPAMAVKARAQLDVTEVDRKPSSCPYLFTWNGDRFEFITDFLGGGETGALLAPGVRNVPDPEEYVRIRGDQLKPRNGRYEVRVTNELEEVLFLDRVHLVAVDHPTGVEIHPNEGLFDPPKVHRVLAVKDARPPGRAVDEQSRDVLDRVRDLDRRFVDELPLLPIRGFAKPHALIVDLAALPATHTRLLLTGWTDYSFSSDNLAAAQAGLEQRLPVVQVEDDRGAWVTAIEDLGFPVGRPQTLVADLAGKWRGPSRRVRIETTMRIYWDQVLAGVPVDDIEPVVRRLAPRDAALTWRGYSAPVSPDGREPFSYDYGRVSADAGWKYFTGRYTREGDVGELLKEADDLFVVTRPGDEIAFAFDALPEPSEGWTRTFLLHSDGFSKEMDINSAGPDAVLPYPFHGMPRYPYAPHEASPRLTRQMPRAETFNTRTIPRMILPPHP